MINLLKPLAILHHIWDLWNLRGFILFSFSLQCILIIGSSLRIQTSDWRAHTMIWLVYLLADWAAYFAIGLVVPINRLRDVDTYDIRSFWAPFLLLHIGGPNTIAGFSLEDNELWNRSVLHIVVQAGATITAIVRSLSKKRLLAPTLLVFVAAFTRYVGRILALHKGSLASLRDSISNESSSQEAQSANDETRVPISGMYPGSIEPVAMVTHSYDLFQKFKGLFCDLSVKADRGVLEIRERLYALSSRKAFTEMEIELGLAYGLFYTKIWTIVEDKVGLILHVISLASEVAALFLWVMADKHGYQKVDVKLTNALLFGGVFLDLVSTLKLVFSDLVICHLIKLCRDSGLVAFTLNWVLVAKNHKWAKRLVLFRRWSGSIKQFNFAEYKVNEHERGCCGSHQLCKLWETFGYEKGVSVVELNREAQKQISYSIYGRALIWQNEAGKREERASILLGQYVKEMYDKQELMSNAVQQICEGLGVVDTLIFWHTTTHWFYSKHKATQDEEKMAFRKFNQQLSEYFMYLLFHQSTMILEGIQLDMTMKDMKKRLEEIKNNKGLEHVNGNGQESVRLILEDVSVMEGVERDALERQKKDIEILLQRQVNGKEKGSVRLISDLASYIVPKLEPNDQTDAIMSEIWIDLLLYAAGHSRGSTHGRQLGKGGELLTVVWLMTTHLGITIELPARKESCPV